MNIFSYNVIISFFYPIIFFIGLLRLILKKENYLSFQQKFFANHDYSEFQKVNIIIHFSSIGELNSIKFLIDKLNNQEILLTCATLSSYNLSKEKYPHLNIIFLPIDFKWNVNKFILKSNLKKILWIDSEIWPNWLNCSKKAKIKNILVNGRLSKKSFAKWNKLKSFSKYLGEKYELIFAKSVDDKERLYEVFKRKVYYFANLKFYLNVNIPKNKKNCLCFASIHKAEFETIIRIITKLDLNLFESITVIPRHIQYSNRLKKMLREDLRNKINIHDKFGESQTIFDKSKIVFMGGSLIHHGGQNPLEALARGCYIVSGKYNDNFRDQYLDLEKLNLATIVNNDTSLISSKINGLVDLNFDNSSLIVDYFKDNKKNLNKMVEMIQQC
jgi:3-deoxy-D-manno-octulosonic-acid transferase